MGGPLPVLWGDRRSGRFRYSAGLQLPFEDFPDAAGVQLGPGADLADRGAQPDLLRELPDGLEDPLSRLLSDCGLDDRREEGGAQLKRFEGDTGADLGRLRNQVRLSSLAERPIRSRESRE